MNVLENAKRYGFGGKEIAKSTDAVLAVAGFVCQNAGKQLIRRLPILLNQYANLLV
ncbi:MAG TPA: hypothetical protein VJ729_03080 [Nitrososphaeraceae archaeon]|nr:hypothetical protein [Nitrososphaeraceae archaeon]